MNDSLEAMEKLLLANAAAQSKAATAAGDHAQATLVLRGAMTMLAQGSTEHYDAQLRHTEALKEARKQTLENLDKLKKGVSDASEALEKLSKTKGFEEHVAKLKEALPFLNGVGQELKNVGTTFQGVSAAADAGMAAWKLGLGDAVTKAGTLTEKLNAVPKSIQISVIAVAAVEIGRAIYEGFKASQAIGQEGKSKNNLLDANHANYLRTVDHLEKARPKLGDSEVDKLKAELKAVFEPGTRKSQYQPKGTMGGYFKPFEVEDPIPVNIDAARSVLRKVQGALNPAQDEKGPTPEEIAKAKAKQQQQELEEEGLREVQELERGFAEEKLVGLDREQIAIAQKYADQVALAEASAAKGAQAATKARNLQQKYAEEYLQKTAEADAREAAAKEKKNQEKAAGHAARLQAEEELRAKGYADEENMRDQLELSALDGNERLAKQEEINNKKRILAIGELKGLEEEKILRLLELNDQLNKKEMERLEKKPPQGETPADTEKDKGEEKPKKGEKKKSEGEIMAEKVGVFASEKFASGMTTALMQFIQGSKSAKEAFTEFAASFMQQVAQMIMQMLILKAIQTIFGMPGGAAKGALVPRLAAAGAVVAAANGVAGVQEISATTYFPQYNLVAGEAGREMMAVFARPQAVNLGGVNAITGSVQGNRLAMLNERDLARLTSVRNPVSYAASGMIAGPDLASFNSAAAAQPASSAGGTGGVIVLKASLDHGVKMEIIEASIAGARLEVENELQSPNSTLSKSVKQVSGV